MYNPTHFAEHDREAVVAAMRTMGAGELITYGTAGLETTLLPLLMNGDATVLTGHLTRANTQWKNADPDVDALVTWRGPQAYVSPGYCPTKQETGKVVPTWNYITVQARGTFVVHDDRDWVENLVRSLTERYEDPRQVPWSVDDAPRDYIDSMLRGIVGVEIRVSALEAKFKLTQNRPKADQLGVIDALLIDHDPGARALAAEMRRVLGDDASRG